MQQIHIDLVNAEQTLEQLLKLGDVPKSKSDYDQDARNIAIAQLDNFDCYADTDDYIIIDLPGTAGKRRAVITKETSSTYTGYFTGFISNIEFSIGSG